jgi:hypothetical protein
MLHSNGKYLQTIPEDFLLLREENGRKVCELCLQNVSLGKVAYKIKSNAPKVYLVTPSKGVLSVGQLQSLSLISRSAHPSPSHSLLILAQAVDSRTNLQSLWQRPGNVQKVRLRLSYSAEVGRNPVVASTWSQALLTRTCSLLKQLLGPDCEASLLQGLFFFLAGLLVGLFFPRDFGFC